jgi:hypothetical protein
LQPEGRIINIRGHHLLCAYAFTGMGYNIAFTENMRCIVEAFRTPSHLMRIVEGFDDVCACCPHSDGRSCRKGEDMAVSMDKAVLAILGIEVDSVYESTFLHRGVEDGVRQQLFHDICIQCSWFTSHCHGVIA